MVEARGRPWGCWATVWRVRKLGGPLQGGLGPAPGVQPRESACCPEEWGEQGPRCPVETKVRSHQMAEAVRGRESRCCEVLSSNPVPHP